MINGKIRSVLLNILSSVFVVDWYCNIFAADWYCIIFAETGIVIYLLQIGILIFFFRLVSTYLVHHGYCATAEAFVRSTGQSIEEEIASIKSRQSIVFLYILIKLTLTPPVTTCLLLLLSTYVLS